MKARIVGPHYVLGQKKGLYVKNVQTTVNWVGKKQVPYGNPVGFDQFITKNVTLTNEKEGLKANLQKMQNKVMKLMQGLNIPG